MSELTTEDTEHAEMMKNLNELTEAIIGAAMEVHRTLGPGLLESTYEMCLCRELSIRGISLNGKCRYRWNTKASN
jgi:GxxExxY protein